jgi:acetyl-CoA carboxylase biotin carboxyl carrier protein
MDERPDQNVGGGQPREQAREASGHDAEQQRGGSRAAGGPAAGNRRDPRRRRHREGQPPQQQQQQYSQRAESSVNMEELRELFGMFTAQGLTEFELEKEGFRIRLRRDHAAQGATHAAAQQPLAPVPQPAQVLPFVPPQITPVAESEAGAAAAAGSQGQGASPTPEAGAGESPDADLQIVTSPIVGTFYRSASPQAEPFVRLGSHVEPDTVVCIIEAMKLMNEILAETSGTVEKIFVENAQPVEYGQPLFGIKKQ